MEIETGMRHSRGMIFAAAKQVTGQRTRKRCLEVLNEIIEQKSCWLSLLINHNIRMNEITVVDKHGNELVITPCDSTHVYIGIKGMNTKPAPWHIAQLEGDVLASAKLLIKNNK